MPRDAGWGGGPTRTGRSAIFAMACVTAQRWLPEEDLKGVARGILENLDEPRLRFVLPATDDTQLSPEWQIEGRLARSRLTDRMAVGLLGRPLAGLLVIPVCQESGDGISTVWRRQQLATFQPSLAQGPVVRDS